jgi:hypothetical protein
MILSLLLAALASLEPQAVADLTRFPAASAAPPPADPRGPTNEGLSTACDSFNRAYSSDLGPDWEEQAGDAYLAGGTVRSSEGSVLLTHARAGSPYADARLTARFAKQSGVVFYVAVIAGYAGPQDCVFAKVQDNDFDGAFDRVFFYRGDNGNPWSTQYTFALSAPMAGGVMRLSFEDDGDTAVLEIEDELTGAAAVFRCSGVLGFASALGTSVGLGAYSGASADDFGLNEGCGSLALAKSGTCPGVLSLRVSGHSGDVALLYGATGGFVQTDPGRPCLGVALQLDRPWLGGILRAESPQAMFNGGGPICGLTVQAVDLTTCSVSNSIVL